MFNDVTTLSIMAFSIVTLSINCTKHYDIKYICSQHKYNDHYDIQHIYTEYIRGNINESMCLKNNFFRQKHFMHLKLKVHNATASFKNLNNCWNTNISFYLETSGVQNSNIFFDVVHFFNTSVI